MEKKYSTLKIYLSTTDKLQHELMYEKLVRLAKNNGIAGVTVLRGIMGYGASSEHISNARFWELTEKLPVVVEMVDETLKLHDFFGLIKTELDLLRKGCMVTIQSAEVLYKKTGVTN